METKDTDRHEFPLTSPAAVERLLQWAESKNGSWAQLIDTFADTVRALLAERDTALYEKEAILMQLVACDVGALGNTRDTVGARIPPGHPYYSAALGAVYAAVDREIQHREQLTAAMEERDRLRAAIRWALGEEGEFGEEPPPLAGQYRQRYWWRTELRNRAGLEGQQTP